MRVMTVLIVGSLLLAGCGADGPGSHRPARGREGKRRPGRLLRRLQQSTGSPSICCTSATPPVGRPARPMPHWPKRSSGCRLSSSTGGEAVFPWWMCQPCSGLPRVVADAEIVVLWGNPIGSGVKEAVESCVGDSGEPGVYTEADWQPFTT